MSRSSGPFRVALTRDFLSPEGELLFGDIGLELLDAGGGIAWEFLPEWRPELGPELLREYDAVIVLGARLTRASLQAADRLALVARFGVGYENIDVQACTDHGIALTITPDGVRRPVATSMLLQVLALSYRLLEKDRLIRAGRWGEKLAYMGAGVTGRVLGLVGLGNIGAELFRLARPLEMVHLAYDPYARADQTAELGVRLVDLPTLLRESDYLCLACPLTPETHHLIGAAELALMKPSAYLVNSARGAVVHEAALVEALRQGRIRGAALDTFEEEPIDPHHPLLEMPNVILTPHAIAWTDECFGGNGRSACQNVLRVARGATPEHVVNREVLASPAFLAKLRASAALAPGSTEGEGRQHD
jgi:phosphoglycerate dehydrogenase-like enzyme